ncbi:MAG: response regulator [Betaproteobacteria bacterium]|nr:response regulator [Betaproteobacteria bacterium]
MSTDSSLKRAQLLEKELPGKRVLIVDRHQNARDSLRLMLSSLSVTSVIGAASSTDALRQVKGHRFDIILSDYLLDDRDGQQLLEELRRQRMIPLSTVFMILTSERSYHNVISVAELTPDDYLIKPFTTDQLQGRMLKALYKKLVFSRIFQFLEEGSYLAAASACDALIAETPSYRLEALRIKGETLNALGEYKDAETLYRQILAEHSLPWAEMGEAIAQHGLGQTEEARATARRLVEISPQYMAAYDFLAQVEEELGNPQEAQAALQEAARISPNNSLRQRSVGEIAMRNGDFERAEKAYVKVLERSRGSSLQQVDDYANLARVLLDRNAADGARRVIQDLRRNWRGHKEGEYAALVLDSLCSDKEGEPGKARDALNQAMKMREELSAESETSGTASTVLSQRLDVDLAHACLAAGDAEAGRGILRRVAAENNEDRQIIARIQGVFTRTGQEEAGKALLEEVSREIISINNEGVMKARAGDFEGSVQLLVEAAERVPNVQFLVNATKAILTLLDQRQWDAQKASQAQGYLQMAWKKNPADPRVLSARELYLRVAGKYRIAVHPLNG